MENLLQKFLDDNIKKVKAIILTDEEKQAAYYEGQLKKFFHVEHEEYWNEQERKPEVKNVK